jgi:Alpha/beta hydrolase domain
MLGKASLLGAALLLLTNVAEARGPDFAKGIISKVPPAVLAGAYTVLVPQVDRDGNEIGGIRLPDITVPLATAITMGDNRLSLEERHRDKADYVAQITRAAEALEKDGYILAEDRRRIIDRADAAPW